MFLAPGPFGAAGVSPSTDLGGSGSHLALWGESLSCLAQSRLSTLFVASRSSPCLLPATRITCKNGSFGLWHHCTGLAQWGSALWLCSQRTSHQLSRISAL